MVHHIVLFRFTASATPDQVDEARRALLGMGRSIPDIRHVTFGPNLAESVSDWPWVLVVSCDDMAAVRRYLEHPAHLEVVRTFVHPIRAARLAVDVERDGVIHESVA